MYEWHFNIEVWNNRADRHSDNSQSTATLKAHVKKTFKERDLIFTFKLDGNQNPHDEDGKLSFIPNS